MAPLFPDFRKIRKRIKRSLNYGSKPPSALNFPLSEFVVEYFDKKCTFDYMEPATSTSISKRGYADPCTLVVALVYLDRLKFQNKNFFDSTDPTALYLPALVLASKVLHDADTFDRVSNSGWAESLEMDAEELNTMEWNFVKNLNWDVAVKHEEFEQYLAKVEYCVAKSFVDKNDFCTYNEIYHLSSILPMFELIKQFLKFISATSFVYCLTFALMTSTIQKMLSTTTDSFISTVSNESSSTTELFYQQQSSKLWKKGEEIELDLNSYPTDEEEKDDRQNTSNSGFCSSPINTIAQKAILEQFQLTFSSFFSCHRTHFDFFIK